MNSFNFSYVILKIAFNFTLANHYFHHASSKINITPKYLQFNIMYVNKILKVMAAIYARLINQNKFKYQLVFIARFDKRNKNDQVVDEIELYYNLKII